MVCRAPEIKAPRHFLTCSKIQLLTSTFTMPIHPNILSTIGKTPLIKLNRVVNGAEATILLKAEFFNPLGSVKDRIGAAMIDAAEREGRLTPGI